MTLRRCALAATPLLLLGLVAPAALAAPARAAGDGLRVEGSRLVEAGGDRLVLRGVNVAHTWYPGETGDSLADIKRTGANAVRVVLASGQRWTRDSAAEVSGIVRACGRNRLVCVLEVHDTTGAGEQSGAASLAQAVQYWLSVRDRIAGTEDRIVLNIGNEPFGNGTRPGAWAEQTSQAIRTLRRHGLEHVLMADAPEWGQDWSGTMRAAAPAVLAADPDRNTVFSVHMYGVYDDAATVRSYLSSYLERDLPIVVGEFGDRHSDGDPDEDAIMSFARTHGIGWFGWSWSGNGGDVAYLDLTRDFDGDRLTAWGRRLVSGPDGLRQTAREATVFGPGGAAPAPAPTAPLPAPPTVPPTSTAPAAGPPRACTATYRTVQSWPGGFRGEVTVRTGSRAADGWRVTLPEGWPDTAVWNATADAGSVRGAFWNARLAAGDTASFGLVVRGAVAPAAGMAPTCSAG